MSGRRGPHISAVPQGTSWLLAQDVIPQGFYLITSCTSTVFMDSS